MQVGIDLAIPWPQRLAAVAADLQAPIDLTREAAELAAALREAAGRVGRPRSSLPKPRPR